MVKKESEASPQQLEKYSERVNLLEEDRLN